MAKKKKKNVKPSTKSTSLAVSVIIPMYNAEEYITECLDSLLNQTFQDFEVIVVDDCSTDNSLEIVKSYVPKFNERLKIAKTEKNSGSSYFLRNAGLNQAGGEYVLFVDADDFILLTALETLYTAAKKNNADVIYTPAFYELTKPNDVCLCMDGLAKKLFDEDKEDQPALIVDEPNKILSELVIDKSEENFHNLWTKFVRREFLLENDIAFSETLNNGGDFIWVIQVYCCANRFLRLKSPFYFHRSYSSTSVSETDSDLSNQASYLISDFVQWLNVLNELTNKIEILRDNTAYSLGAAKSYFGFFINVVVREDIKQLLSNQDIYKAILGKFVNRDDLADFVMPFIDSIIDKRGNVVDSSLQTFNTLKMEIEQIKKLQDLFTPNTNVTDISFDSPSISVIIPMYNVEKYIGECLSSLLAQTFQNFEVIIIDDGSTDSSCAVVESYIPKFGERLSLYPMGKNTKHPGELRNIGLTHARGEYIYFMDSDDALIKTGLEELYTLAKEYDADVVYCERYYMSTGIGEDFVKNIHVAKGKIQPPPYVDKPILESEDLSERVQNVLNRRYWGTPWLKLIRHNLLKEHKIVFPALKSSEDDIWNYGLIFSAKKWLRVPNMVYVRRMREDSITSTKKTPQQTVNFWLKPIFFGLKEIDKLMSQIKFFQDNPQERYAILEWEAKGKLRTGFKEADYLTPHDVYEAVKEECGENFGEYDVLISALCTQIFGRYKTLKEAQRRLKVADDEINRLQDSMKHILESNSITPAISVIIPMFNAEKYIGELLDSLLNQTFKAFEVIVVDDCSTDDSVNIVKSYVDKFYNNQLKLHKLEKNSGTGGSVPRNFGLRFASGEYVYFSDADDFIAKNALETFYNAAKEYDADVVYSASYNLLHRLNESKILKDGLSKKLRENKPILTIDNPDKNIQQLELEKTFNFPWTYFTRRDFLIKNQIVFPEVPNGVDHLWVIQVWCYTKRFLRIPNALYFYRRYHEESISTKKREPREQVYYWVRAFALWLKALGEISSQIEVLSNNPLYVLEIAKRHFDWCLNRTGAARRELTDEDIYETLHNEFTQMNISSNLVVPFFFSVLESKIKKVDDAESKLRKFKLYLSARLDIKFVSKIIDGDFQIISISDKSASVSKPEWLQSNGVGYQIQSYTGQLEFVVEPTKNGKVELSLRGLDVRDPKNNSKRVSCWIDYTRLVINEKIIFDTLTPTSWEKFYRYEIAVKAGEKIKIKVDWLPHGKTPIKLKALKPSTAFESSRIPHWIYYAANNELKKEAKKVDSKVSIIVPIYNAEKYISECLDSLIKQTFQNFEVIVVDNCSTDNSVAVVESYAPKFNSQLTIAKTKTYSGNANLPRNVGLSLAKGDYVYFIDAEGFIHASALETLYKAATDNKADVVYTSCYLSGNISTNESRLEKDGTSIELRGIGAKGKTATSDDNSNKLLQDVLLKNQYSATWTKFVQRKFLIENKIDFPEIAVGGEELWTILVCANAKKFLRLTKPIYFLRQLNLNSQVTSSDFVTWFKAFADISNKIEYLKENTALCSKSAKTFFDSLALSEEESYTVYSTLSNELETADDLTKDFCLLIDPSVMLESKAEDSTPAPVIKPSDYAVSVVVPLHNEKKYINECLDSLLKQKFKNFEVIIVDDSSTSNLFKIFKEYASKFNGRIKLVKTNKDSSGESTLRNKGLSSCKGEYVFFMEAGDTLKPTGLETMYNAAKQFDADTVYCEKYFALSKGKISEVGNSLLDEPALETSDLTERIDKALKQNDELMYWLRFVSRSLLINNNITFSNESNDVGWAFAVLLASKNFLRIPNACYVKRIEDKAAVDVHKLMNQMILGLKRINDFMGDINFLNENPRYRYELLNLFIETELKDILKQCDNLSSFELYDLFREHSGESLGEYNVLISCLCSKIISRQKELNQLKVKE